MKCDIEKCKEMARWMVDDHGVDTYLCPAHYDNFKTAEQKIKQDRLKAGIF